MRVFTIIWIVLCIAVTASCTYLPDLPAVEGVVVTEERDYILIEPEAGIPGNTGLLFYPGGLVDPHAYINQMAGFAKSGYGHAVVIVKEPGNLAVLNPGKGMQVLREISSVENWVIAGHSLGGAMACTVVAKEQNTFMGLILLAAYPAENTNISALFLPVLSIYGSLDGIVSPGDIDKAAPRLPPGIPIADADSMLMYPGATYYHSIEGGIHSFFGDYGDQKGDGKATITRAQQQEETILFIERFFEVNNLN